jgi:hypothetical protein
VQQSLLFSGHHPLNVCTRFARCRDIFGMNPGAIIINRNDITQYELSMVALLSRPNGNRHLPYQLPMHAATPISDINDWTAFSQPVRKPDEINLASGSDLSLFVLDDGPLGQSQEPIMTASRRS